MSMTQSLRLAALEWLVAYIILDVQRHEEAEIVLEAELIASGLMGEEDAIGSITGEDYDCLTVILESGTIIRLNILTGGVQVETPED